MPAVQVAILHARGHRSGREHRRVWRHRRSRRLSHLRRSGGRCVVAALPVPGGSGEIARTVAEMDALLAELQQRATRSSQLAHCAAPPLPAGAPIGFAPTYFPARALARRDAVEAGRRRRRSGVDLQVQPVTAATISGSISGDVPNLAAMRLTIVIEGPRTTTQFSNNPVLSLKPNGTASSRSATSPRAVTASSRVARGQTTAATPPMSAASVGRGGQPPLSLRPFLYAVADVDVLGSAIGDLALALQPGSTFSGRIRFDAGAQPVPGD